MNFAGFLIATMLAIATTHAADVQQLIDDAISRGEKQVVIPAGEHRLDRVLRLSDVSDFTLDGTGATLIFTNLRDGGILVRDSQRLTLRGFTVDFDPLPFTQATVESVDMGKGEVRFAVHDGYPDLAPHFLTGRAHLFSPKTLGWKRDAPDIYATEAKAIDPRHGILRFSPEKKLTLAAFQPGDYVALDFRHSRGLRIEQCSDVRIEDVTFWSAPSIAVICRFMNGDNFFRYKIARGPLPPGAKIPRLMSTSADGLNYAYARKGPIIEKCDFSFMGDDSVNLHGIAFYVAREDGNVIYLLRPYPQEDFASVISPGDEVRSLSPDSFDVTSRSQVVKFGVEPKIPEEFTEMAARVWKSAAIKAGKLTVYRLELSQPLDVKAGDFVEIPSIAAPGYVIRDNHFHDHRGRALRLMSSDGLVEKNLIEDIKQSAITLGPEFTFFREAGWVRDVTIRDNVIRRSAFDPSLQLPQTYTLGAISVFHRGETPAAPRPAMKHENIRIVDNTIEDSGGPAIHIAQSRNVQVSGNTIRNPNQVTKPGAGSVYGLTTGKPIVVDASTDVTIEEKP